MERTGPQLLAPLRWPGLLSLPVKPPGTPGAHLARAGCRVWGTELVPPAGPSPQGASERGSLGRGASRRLDRLLRGLPRKGRRAEEAAPSVSQPACLCVRLLGQHRPALSIPRRQSRAPSLSR